MSLTNSALEKRQQFFENEIARFHGSSLFSEKSREIVEIMRRGREKFVQLGLPDRRNENWKYTDLTKNLKFDFKALGPCEPSERLAAQFTSSDITFFNGYMLEMNAVLPKGVSLKSNYSGELLKRALERTEDGLTALNLSLLSEALFLKIEDGVKLSQPIFLNFYYGKRDNGDSEKAFGCYPGFFIEVGKNSEAVIFEKHIGLDVHSILTAAQTQIRVGEGARLVFTKLIQQKAKNEHIGQLDVEQSRNSHVQTTIVTKGGSLARQSVRVEQTGPGANSECNGLYLAKDQEHHDHRTTLKHLAPHGWSRQLYKGILEDQARSVFNGKIYIAQDAQEVNSSQMNNNLLLSRKAEADTKPELEVYADNVKAEHGATVGRIEESQLFYLMSRSIDLATATKMLTHGFIGDVLLRIGDSQIVDQLAQREMSL